MEDKEIDLLEVIAKLWGRRKVILQFVLFFLMAGVAVSFLLPRKYTAHCTLGLEAEDRTTRISVEGISAFQSMNMGDTRHVKIVSPALYPDILFSVPFQKELIYAPLFVNEMGDTVNFYKYLIKPQNTYVSVRPVTGTEVERLTPEENQCLGYLKRVITVKVNHKDGNLKLTVDMPDPHMAARLTYKVQEMLQQYITKFRIAKAQAALDFIEGRCQEVKGELERKQQALIEFRERYKTQNSIQLKTKEKILNNDYELFFSLYSDIIRQREKAKIQVKEDMPVLTVIEPVVVPVVPSKPQRSLIILAALFAGIIAGCTWVLIHPLLLQIIGKKHNARTIPLNPMKKIS